MQLKQSYDDPKSGPVGPTTGNVIIMSIPQSLPGSYCYCPSSLLLLLCKYAVKPNQPPMSCSAKHYIYRTMVRRGQPSFGEASPCTYSRYNARLRECAFTTSRSTMNSTPLPIGCSCAHPHQQQRFVYRDADDCCTVQCSLVPRRRPHPAGVSLIR